ncbi:reverse transcriptase [Cucumis melo var. makuwa]|uniref:Reverse transcriptase n=1 Tax=Cucumis melo var. makuwa TaxID=1194695 RepID=A0A5A7VDT8_CUCMM|nr:reverse transcriptase [Cucumis melo var. makuwa]
MDDFDVVLGMEFLLQHKFIPMPLAQCLVVTSSNSTVVQAKIKQLSGVRMISVLQLKNGFSREEPTFMAISLVDEQIEIGTVPVEIRKVLNEYVDILLPELSRSLPPRRGIDHNIELVPGAKPPTKNAYRMASPELVKLRKQLDEFLAVGFIKPAKASYGAPVLFQKKKDGTLRLCINYEL